jgi:hypothetical protein
LPDYFARPANGAVPTAVSITGIQNFNPERPMKDELSLIKLLAAAIIASLVLAFANSAHAARHLNDLVEQGHAVTPDAR